MNEFDRQAAHSARLAMTPGFWVYTQHDVVRLEATPCKTYMGLRAAVGVIVKAAGYRPSAHEVSEI